MDNQAVTETEKLAIGFWTKHKRLCIELLVAVALVLGGYASGRFTTKPVVETKTVTKTEIQTKTVVQYQDRVVEKKIYVTAQKKDEHEDTTTIKKPDGTVITHTTDDTHVAENTSDTEDKNSTHNQTTTQDQTVKQTQSVTKLQLQQPNWDVFAGVGYSLPHALGSPDVGIVGLNGWVVQAGIDRRIIGPFWFGIFGNTQGTIGLNLRVVW